MQSPYFNGNAAPSFMPPPGLMQALIERDKQMQEDAKSIGKFAGSAVAGIGGAVQGAGSPEVFGAGTSKTSGGMQGFMQNFNAGMNGGQGGGGATGFAGLMNRGGGDGGSGGGGPMNFKQLAALGKTADGLRDTIRTSTPMLEGQDPKILGMTDEEWKHAGTLDKTRALGMFQQQQQLKAADLGYKAGLQDYERVGQEMRMRDQQMAEQARQAKANQEIGPWMGEVNRLTAAPEGTPLNSVELNPPVALNRNAAIAAANAKFPNAPGAPQFDNTVSSMAKFAEMGTSPADLTPQYFERNGMRGVFNPKGGNFQLDPGLAVDAKLAAEKELVDYKQSIRQNMLDAGMKPAKDEGGNAIEGVYIRPDGKTLDLRSGLEKQTGLKLDQPGAKPTAAAAPSAAPAVNGVAEWDPKTKTYKIKRAK